MNRCTIRYRPAKIAFDYTLTGELIHSTNNEYIIHTADTKVKSIRFDSSNMRGSYYSTDGEISNIKVKGFREWDNPFEINIKFTDKSSNRVNNHSYDVDFYGCVSFQYTNLERNVLSLEINNKCLDVKIRENDLYVYNNSVSLKTNFTNDLNFNKKSINIGTRDPIESIYVEDQNCNSKIKEQLN